MNAIKSVRLPHYDYKSNGFYFVTVVTHNRQKIFADQNKDVLARFIGRLGQMQGVKVDYYVVMSDHIHMILVLEDCALKLGEVVRRFKALVSHELGIRVWQPNYYEHVIRNETALHKIREYIQNNPAAEQFKWAEFYKL